MTFDETKPYGEVSGVLEGYPGVRYTQNGVFYGVKHQQIFKLGEGQVEPIQAAKIDVEVEVAAVTPTKSLSWQALKKRVEEAGEIYQGKAHALEFLEQLDG